MRFVVVSAPAALLPTQSPAPPQLDGEACVFRMAAPQGGWRRRGHPMFASMLMSSAATAAAGAAPCSILAFTPASLSLTPTPPAAAPCREQQPCQEQQILQLPFGIHQGTTLMQYAWDGHGVVTLDPELCNLSSQQQQALRQQGGVAAVLRRWLLQAQEHLSGSFLPNRKDVNDDYWEWLQWRMTSRFLTSTMQNLSTQSMLMALGLGAKKSVAASAAINWLLKDGVGRIARMTVATQFCQSFDSDLKRIRYITSLVQSVLMCGEFVTPFFPHYFLPLASISNVGKAISLAAFVAVAPSFQRALCRGNNLADLTAKNQAQHMVVDMLALGVSASAMFLVRHNERARILMPLLAYPLLAVSDAWATYNELKSIELKALNRERAEMVTEHWVLLGKVPSAYEISHEEHLLLPPDIAGGLLPLSITSLDKLVQSPQHVNKMVQLYRSEQYMMAIQMPSSTATGEGPSGSSPQQQRQQQEAGVVEGLRSWISGWGLPWMTRPAPKLQMSLSEGASASDILKAILEAGHLRHVVRSKLEAKLRNEQGRGLGHGQGRGPPGPSASSPSPSQHPLIPGDQLWGAVGALLSERELEGCVAEARRHAAAGLPRFLAALAAQGWKTRSFLLSTTEKVRYVALSKADARQQQKQQQQEKEKEKEKA